MSISKYSWEIYLIHVLPLIYIRHLVIGKGPNIVCDSIILTVLVTLASFYMAYIIHNVIVKNVQKLMKKLIDIFSKIKIKEIIKNNIKQ